MESVKSPSPVHIDFTSINLTSKDPKELFIHWRQEIMSLPDNNKRNTVTLATLTPDDNLSATAVLFCGANNFSYKISSKEQEIEHNPMGALDFLWPFLRSDGVPVVTEVRVEGRMEKVSTEESQTYFDSEPIIFEMQEDVNNQTQLITENRAYDQRIKNLNYKIPKPPQCYRLRPSTMEFYERVGDDFADRVRTVFARSVSLKI